MGLHVGTRTPDLYRVNFEVSNLKPFPYLAFPHFTDPKIARKWPSFDDELLAGMPGFVSNRKSLDDVIEVDRKRRMRLR
jgi:hypothetical protein